MAESDTKNDLKSAIASNKPRDKEGHFIHVDPEPPSSSSNNQSPLTNNPSPSPISQFLSDHTHYAKSQDDLLDVHVGNPLSKITHLLEEIKKQKAFAFTLKGSLGIMGVFLALSVFGIFGGGKMLCDKGIQTKSGTIRVLRVADTETSSIPYLSKLISFFKPAPYHPRTVLFTSDNQIIHLPYTTAVDLTKYPTTSVVISGNFDSCSQTLSVTDPNGVE